jgi:hypothetical protein
MVSNSSVTVTDDPSRVMMRQIAGSFSQYEKTRFVLQLRGAGERIREAGHKCEGRKSYASATRSWSLQPSASIGAHPKGTEDH